MAVRPINDGYYVEVFLGINPVTGKKIRKTKTFRPRSREKKKEAKTWENDLLNQYEKGELNLEKDPPLQSFLESWFGTKIEGKKAYNTVRRYRTFVNCISSHLGRVKLSKLTVKMVEDFYSAMAKEMKTLKDGTTKRRYADGTILKTHKMFKLAMNQAVKWEILTRNVVALADSPSDDKREIKYWNLEQVSEFLEYIKGTVLYLPVFIASRTGLREGEISALRWEDINFKEEYIMVSYNMVEKKGEGLVREDTKTPASEAKVAMTNDLSAMLKSVLKDQKKHKLQTGIATEYVCRWEDGRALRPTYISKAFTREVKKHNIEKITFHGLRHSHATILYSLGADSQEISKRLRHSRVSTTDDIYIHVTEEIKKSTAQLFDQAVENSK